MNTTTKKLLIFGGIVAVIIIIIALKKKQDEEKERGEGEGEGEAKLPHISGIIEAQIMPLPKIDIEGRGPAVGTLPTITFQEAQIQSIQTAKDATKKVIPAQIEMPNVAEKSVNYFDANCR